MELRAAASAALSDVDVLMTPTTPTTFTVADMLADPIVNNAQLGLFTTFTNLLDFAAVAVPAGVTNGGLPFGVTVHGACGTDGALASMASAIEAHVAMPMGATGLARTRASVPATVPSPAHGGDGTLDVVVVGAHLRGQPLHGSLLELGATFVRETTTAAEYALYALPGTTPPKPGLVRVAPERGKAIAVEVYALPVESIGALLATIPAPLGLGSIALADGTDVHGFLCEAVVTASAADVSDFGGWREYVHHVANASLD